MCFTLLTPYIRKLLQYYNKFSPTKTVGVQFVPSLKMPKQECTAMCCQLAQPYRKFLSEKNCRVVIQTRDSWVQKQLSLPLRDAAPPLIIFVCLSDECVAVVMSPFTVFRHRPCFEFLTSREKFKLFSLFLFFSAH